VVCYIRCIYLCILCHVLYYFVFFFSSRRRHTRWPRDWSSDVSLPILIGGYDFEKSEFNRAFQACRQPGSAFKPVIYSAAIEQRNFTASTILLDAPIVTDDDSTGKRWKPENYEQEFVGEVPVRLALIHSMNLPAIRTLQAVGVKAAGAWAHKLGISTKINEDLSMRSEERRVGKECRYRWWQDD